MTGSRLCRSEKSSWECRRSQQLSPVKLVNAGAFRGRRQERGLSSLLAEYSLSVADFQKGLEKIVLLRKRESMRSAR